MQNVKKIIKVLAGKARGLNRKKKVVEMIHGLTILNLMVCRHKRDNKLYSGFSGISYEELDAVDLILKRAEATR